MNNNIEASPLLSVYVVDSEDLARAGICSLLEEDPTVKLLGSSSCLEGVEALMPGQQPDVLLVKGLANAEHLVEPVRRITQKYPQLRVMVLIELITQEVVSSLVMNRNVGGICSCRVNIATIVSGIHAIGRGGLWFDPRVGDVVRQAVPHHVAAIAQAPPPPITTPLTGREEEILQCVARGLTNQQIAAELQISVETVKTYIRRIMDKSAIRSRHQLLNSLPQGQANRDLR